ncbi:MAG: response regulator [Oxalobacteraceae bacterium]|nr:MAG: response regulator [Oxalobacteraceae bacterium]
MKKKVVLVQDNKDILDIMDQVLEEEGFDVTASLTTEPIDKIEEIEPDIVIVDDHIKGEKKGSEVIKELKSDPQTAMLASMPEPGLAYLRSTDRVDPVAALAKVQAAVLIVQGCRDDFVPSAHADMLRAGRKTLPTEVAVFPNLTHFYKDAPPGLPPMQSMGLDTDSDPAVADAIAAWANRLVR